MPLERPLFALFACTAVACGGLPTGGDDDDDVTADGGVRPTIQVDYRGTYATNGRWDLSQPFGPDGIGGMVADLMIDQIIGLVGVPSAFES